MNLSDLIRIQVKSVRYSSAYLADHALQYFYSSWELVNGVIMEIPMYPDMEYQLAGEVASRNHWEREWISETARRQIEGQGIINFHFSYFQGEIEDDQKAYIELENGKYVTENNFAPDGVNHMANLQILSQVEFKQLNTADTELRPLR